MEELGRTIQGAGPASWLYDVFRVERFRILPDGLMTPTVVPFATSSAALAAASSAPAT